MVEQGRFVAPSVLVVLSASSWELGEPDVPG